MHTTDNGDADAKAPNLREQAKQLLATMSPLEAQIILAKRGNRAVLPDLRKSLDENPELWRRYGDLSLQTQQLLIETLGGRDLYAKECIVRQVEEMKKELAGPNPTPLEKLLVGRVTAAWLRTVYIEGLDAQAPGGEYIKLAEYRLKCQQAANNQFIAAIKMLNIVRSAAAKTITVEVRQAEAVPQAAPSVPEVNGARGGVHNGHVNRFNGHAAGAMSKAINGHNRHDRLNGRATILNGNVASGQHMNMEN